MRLKASLAGGTKERRTLMDIEKLIEQLKNLEACAYGYHINGEVLGMDCSDFEQVMVDAADEISKVPTLQAENEKLRAELEQVKRCIEIVENQRDSAIIDYNCSWEYVKNWLLDDRLRELDKADKDGRLVVLPCKVGDTVYFRTYDCNGTVDLGIQPHKVTTIVGHAIVRGRYTDVGLLPGQYGVSWFLTREEAEKALEAMKNE